VRVVEAKRAETKGPPHEQLLDRLVRWFVWPTLAVGFAFYLIAFIAEAPWPLTPIGLLAATGVGLKARRWVALRPAAHAWMATNIGFLLFWIALVVNNLVT